MDICQVSRGIAAKPALYILTVSPFSQRDYERFGVGTLSLSCNVRILDCTAWIRPHVWQNYNSIVIKNASIYSSVNCYRDLLNCLDSQNGGWYIDYMGEGIQASIIRLLLKRKNIRRVVIDSSIMPPFPGQYPPLLSRIGRLIKKAQSGQFSHTVFRKAISTIADQLTKPDLAICSGANLSHRSVGAKTKIYAHALDYDLFLQFDNEQKRSIDKQYAVYIHQAHEYQSDGTSRAQAEDYYSSLSRCFDKFERDTGLDVVVAAHPRMRTYMVDMLKPRRIEVGATAQLIRDSRLVFEHYSAARHFAILWRRPIVHLITHHFPAEYYLYVQQLSALLRTPLVNIDALPFERFDIESWLKLDEKAFEQYQERYIKTAGSPRLPVWKIFSDYINRLPPESVEPANK